jgi:hypothetical protein
MFLPYLLKPKYVFIATHNNFCLLSKATKLASLYIRPLPTPPFSRQLRQRQLRVELTLKQTFQVENEKN